MSNNPRIYRAVLLRADEAESLNRDAENERMKCCGHLDVFHKTGKTADGGTWRTCNVGTAEGGLCGCTEFTDPSPFVALTKKADAMFDRNTRCATVFWSVIVGVVGGALALLLGQWLGSVL